MQWNISHKRNEFESVLVKWINLELVIQSKSERENKYINAYIWNLEKW